MNPLDILITCQRLADWTGSETATRDFALGLLRAGHRPTVFSPTLGPLARELAAAGVPVTDDLEKLVRAPGVVHGTHFVPALEAMMRFPDAAALFVCHGRLPWEEIPPLWPGIGRYVAVDLNVQERLEHAYRIPRERIEFLPNAIDLARFCARGPLPASPRNALVFSNYAGLNTHLEPIGEACRRLGIPLTVIGAGADRPDPRPELALPRYDLVFAKARCALEAMATGCAVVLCDVRGLGPMVTQANVESLRPWNFGMRCLTAPLDPAGIVREAEKYSAGDAAGVSSWVRARAGLADTIARLVAIYRSLLESSSPTRSRQELLAGFLAATARKLGEFELSSHEQLEGEAMFVLSVEDAAQLELRDPSDPGVVRAGASFAVRVRLLNRSRAALRSSPPYPVHLSYRWLGADPDAGPEPEPERTPIPTGLAPGQDRSFAVRVVAPRCTGPCTRTLRLTVVQERVRWLDEAEPPVQVELAVRLEPGLEGRPE